MGSTITGITRRSLAVSAVIALLAALLGTTEAAAHPSPEHGQQEEGGLGVLVNSPDALAGFRPGNHWSGSARVQDQTADLVYAGTGCTPVPYLQTDVEGKIALVDDQLSSPFPGDVCPAYAFVQKAQAAERAGAIGLVQVRRDDQVTGRNAVTTEIPVLELGFSDGQPIRDAVVDDEETVNVTLTRLTEVPTERLSDVPCEDGMAGPFECDGVDLLGFVPVSCATAGCTMASKPNVNAVSAADGQIRPRLRDQARRSDIAYLMNTPPFGMEHR
jgi:hypothetical protein